MQRRFSRLSPAEKTGVIALLLAFLLSLLCPLLALFPLLFFLLACLIAPFFPGYGFFLPIISRGNPENNQVALTFDDGPSPLSTPILLDLLARHKLLATFFVVGRLAAKYPDLITAILAQGHTIGNHSHRHDPLLMLRTPKTLHEDIHTTQEILKKQGVTPLVFRPPAGITNPRLQRVLARENLLAVNYSCRAMDGGNRNVRNLAGKILQRLRPGDIIMLHDLPPQQPRLSDYWQQELDHLFAALKDSYQVVALEEIIRHPVMTRESVSPD
ncbi:MAG: polysaccharide deacetylase family protein [Deltaproteobacteria bacterium]|nr:polysaccharide deacetylase family protein [Deltaproteobacteria bacterium]